jgi:hypothetical protein
VRRCVVQGGLLALLTLGQVQPVRAQSNTVDLSVGYSYLTNDDLAVNQSNMPWGFAFDTAFKVNSWLSIAGDVNGHFKFGIEPSTSLDRVVPPLPTQEFQAYSFNLPETGFCSSRLEECDVRIQTVSGVAGPRFLIPAGRVRAFAHVMAGATRSLRKIGFFAHTSTNFTIQPGGGFDVDVTNLTALRIQGDYRQVFFGEQDPTEGGASLVSKGGSDHEGVMFSVGVVFKLGGRP